MTKDRQVTLIGSGNVATVLGRMLHAKGYTIRQVYSRHHDHAAALAKLVDAAPVSDTGAIDDGADVYLVCVTDDALPAVAAGLSFPGKLVIHTAGSASKELLSSVTGTYGVLWPMKMIRKEMESLGPVTIVADGNSEETLSRIRAIALDLSETVTTADDGMRLKMHMLASFAANFSNHLFRLAADYCAAEGLDFALFYPIIQETARAIQGAHPAKLQAGPAFRGDRRTLEKHRQLLQAYPRLSEVYEAMTDSLLRTYGHL